VDRYARVHDLAYLSDNDWTAVETVSRWLKVFRTATARMSSSKTTTLSTIYSTFTKLQDTLRTQLRDLDSSLPQELGQGLQRALIKLSEYFSKADDTPFYLWASCK
jgi:hypothetical protein